MWMGGVGGVEVMAAMTNELDDQAELRKVGRWLVAQSRLVQAFKDLSGLLDCFGRALAGIGWEMPGLLKDPAFEFELRRGEKWGGERLRRAPKWARDKMD